MELQKREKRAHKKRRFRIGIVYSIAFLSFSFLVFRAAYVQVDKGASFRSTESSAQFVKVAVTPQRGWIYDANGQVLAWDTPTDNIVLDNFTTVSKTTAQQIANLLAPVLNTTVAKLYTKMTTDTADVQIPLATNATDSQITFIVEHKSELPNVEINQTYERQYPEGDLAGQVLGYVGSITAENVSKYHQLGYLDSQKVGVSGLEYQYESKLQGSAGYEMLTVDPSTGSVASAGYAPLPTAGDNLQLTLDGHLQAESQNIIQNIIDSSPNKSVIADASAVMLDAKTGGVLSMISYPYLNPNWFTEGKPLNKSQVNYLNTSGAQENFPIQATAYPGSTVKPANLMTALSDGVLTPTSEIDDNGYIYIGKSRINEDMGMQFGWLNPIRAVAVSSDVYFYEVGLETGKWYGSSALSGGTYPSKDGSYQHYLNTDFVKGINTIFQGEWNFGLGPKTGVDLPGEASGRFYIEGSVGKYYVQVPYNLQASEASVQKTGEYANDGSPQDLAESSIGQSQQFTTMQLATYAMNLSNDGKKLKPHLLSAVYQPNDTPTSGAKPIQAFKPTVTGQVAGSAQDFSIVKQAMHEVTTGSDSTAAGLFNNEPYQVAAKTGTAQIVVNGQKTDNSVFICYAPLDHPIVAMAVMIPGGGYGASMAGVIAKQMMDAYFNEHHEPFMPKVGWTTAQIPSNWPQSKANQLP